MPYITIYLDNKTYEEFLKDAEQEKRTVGESLKNLVLDYLECMRKP